MTDYGSRITGLRFAKVLVWLVYFFFLLATIILTLAFFLLLFNASTDAEFTRWVYRNADRVLEPFRGIFPSVEHDNGSVIDYAIIFAIIAYGIFALLVHSLVGWIDAKIRDQKLKEQQAIEGAREPGVTWQSTTQYAADQPATTTGTAEAAGPAPGGPAPGEPPPA